MRVPIDERSRHRRPAREMREGVNDARPQRSAGTRPRASVERRSVDESEGAPPWGERCVSATPPAFSVHDTRMNGRVVRVSWTLNPCRGPSVRGARHDSTRHSTPPSDYAGCEAARRDAVRRRITTSVVTISASTAHTARPTIPAPTPPDEARAPSIEL